MPYVFVMHGWQLSNVPDHCVCGSSFNVDHAMICRHGGLTFVRHNELRDLTATWLREVCHDVAVEPPLQPLSGESITPNSAIRGDDARADIHARGFWGRRQSAFFDIRVFHPNAPSYRHTQIASLFRKHELEKKEDMEIVSVLSSLLLLHHWFFLLLGVLAGRPPFSTVA